jgi:tetratricopeptide (TPR) repeat protein
MATTYNSIGNLYYSQNKYSLALENYMKCLEIREKIKGKDSLDVAASLNNIAGVYDDQGKSDLALENYFKCLEI